MCSSLIISPTYDEVLNIHDFITQVLTAANEYHLLIIDDNSPDGTALIVKQLMKKFDNRLFLIQRTAKLGLASAYKDGFKWASSKNYKYVVTMDSDLSHDPKDIPALFTKLKDYDLIIGSRYIDGIRIINWTMGRLLLSYCASKYVRLVLKLPFKDPTSGFNAYNLCRLTSINLDEIFSTGYAFQIEIKWRIYRQGLTVYEYPIIFYERKVGQSKMSKNIIWEAIFNVLKMKFISLKKKYFTHKTTNEF